MDENIVQAFSTAANDNPEIADAVVAAYTKLLWDNYQLRDAAFVYFEEQMSRDVLRYCVGAHLGNCFSPELPEEPPRVSEGVRALVTTGVQRARRYYTAYVKIEDALFSLKRLPLKN